MFRFEAAMSRLRTNRFRTAATQNLNCAGARRKGA